MTILATVIVLGVLIFVHELGHFGAAKAVGVEVQRFSIGLGPKVFGFKYGETEYVVSLIPLGGYVKMGGMDDEVMDRLEGGSEDPVRVAGERDFDSKPIWARTFVISAGVIMNMLFAFGVYTFVIAKWGLPELSTTRVGIVMAETLPPGTEALAAVTPGSRFVRVGDRAVEDWGDVRAGFLTSTAGPIRIEVAEPANTFEIRIPAVESERRELFGSVASWVEAGVGAVNPGSPADKAGLEAGDRILSVSGVQVRTWWDFVDQIAMRPGERVEITIMRDDREVIRAVTLDAEEEAGAFGIDSEGEGEVAVVDLAGGDGGPDGEIAGGEDLPDAVSGIGKLDVSEGRGGGRGEVDAGPAGGLGKGGEGGEDSEGGGEAEAGGGGLPLHGNRSIHRNAGSPTQFTLPEQHLPLLNNWEGGPRTRGTRGRSGFTRNRTGRGVFHPGRAWSAARGNPFDKRSKSM